MGPVSASPALLLLLLLVVFPASPQTYQAFQRKHMDYPKTGPFPSDRLYCNLMMRNRSMTTPICKHFNSFINDPADAVVDICGKGGTNVSGNLYDSHAYFNLTNCKLTGGPKPPCDYKGWANHTRIEVACEGGFPVHFHKMII